MLTIPFYLAHGAGAGHQSSDFLRAFSERLTQHYKRSVIPVTFAYMAQQEAIGKKRPPTRFDKLVPEYTEAISDSREVVVAGKSMGGRVATQLFDQPQVKAIVCLGFPFHPPGKPEKHRLSFLEKVDVPCLIIQGTRDPFGKPDWVNQQVLNQNIEVQWVEGADHDFKTLKKQNLTGEQVMIDITSRIEDWLEGHGLQR